MNILEQTILLHLLQFGGRIVNRLQAGEHLLDVIGGLEASQRYEIILELARALEINEYSVAKYIGAYAAAMNGVDVVVFTAGVGENDNVMRTRICQYLGYLGITLDEEKNAQAKGVENIITTEDSTRLVMAIPTNEELAIARETVALI